MSVRLYQLASELNGMSEDTLMGMRFKVTYAALVGERRIYQTTHFTVLEDDAGDIWETAAQIISCINKFSQGKIVKVETVAGHYRHDEALVDVGDRRGYATFKFDTPNCDRSGVIGIPFPKPSTNEEEVFEAFGDYINEGTPGSSNLGLITWNSRDNPTALMAHPAERMYDYKYHAGVPKKRNVNPTFNDAVGVTDTHIGDAEAS